MANYAWPSPQQCRLIGKDIPRIDASAKVRGQAKYTQDVNEQGMLYARVVRSTHARAKIKRIDISPAKKVKGFKAAWIIQPVGTEILWAGDDLVAVAAIDEHSAEMAARAVKIEYAPLPHLVLDGDCSVSARFLKPMDPEVLGHPEQAFDEANVTSEGNYGMPVIIHSCLESHGSVVSWRENALKAYIATQSVSGVPGQFSQALQFPQNKVQVICEYVGGAYGSKLAADRWGLAAAQLSKLCGGVPVKLAIERHAEQEVGGCRPSAYAHVKLAAKKDGTLTAWESKSWSTGGIGGGSQPPIPYLISKLPNQRREHTQIVNNIGPARSMRAPHHPQACLLTMCALDDLAAKLNMNLVELLLKNLNLVLARADVFKQEIEIADQLMQWTQRWRPRGSSTGVIRRGMGVSIHAWPGKAHKCQCDLSIHPDGSVAIRCGTQDIGTGTRTVMAIVAAETLGLPLEAIEIDLGDSTMPTSDASGGSGTVGGAGSAVRRAAVDALTQLFSKVAPELGTTPDNLEVGDSSLRVKGEGPSMTWKQACSKLRALPLTVRGTSPGTGDLVDSGSCGVQMADVSVDTGTGVVQINKIVAVQDCGLVIDRKTTMSQLYGSIIMGIGYSLYEEKLMDQNLGRMLNPNIEFYRLCGIGDVGEIVVHLMSGKGFDERGIIGCGEPGVISPGAAISNAVANAIGVRVPRLPLTPDRVLTALEGAQA